MSNNGERAGEAGQFGDEWSESGKPTTPAINQVRVLHLLRTHGALSRADIARHTGLTKATASRLIAELQRRTLVREIGVGSLSRGRRPVMYEFNTASAIALGVEVRQTECQLVVTELDATPLQREVYPLADTRVSTFIDLLERMVADVRQKFKAPLAGIGIGIPGTFDHQRQTVVLAEHLEWTDVELVKLIQARLKLSVYVANRADAAALGERWYGAGRGRSHLVLVNIGTGIKAGLIVGGQLYWGANGSAGEIGHMTLVPDGPVCVCGKRGCLEALASTQAILERVRSLARTGRAAALLELVGHSAEALTRQDVLRAAQAGDPVALEAFREAGTYVGMGVANMINAFNPERVILSGLASQAPPIFLEAVKRAARAHAFEIPWRAVDIVLAELGQEAVAVGAAALLLSDLLQPTHSPFPLTLPASRRTSDE